MTPVLGRQRQVLPVSIDVSAVPAQPAGAGRYVIELVRRVAAKPEVDLTLLARTDDGERWRELAPTAATRAIAPTRRPLRLAWEQTGLRRARAGVHHGPHYTMPVGPGRPVVVTVHDLTYFDHPEWHERSKVIVFRRAIRYAAHHAAAIICVSQVTADRLAALVQPTVAVHVVPHGVDTARFNPAEATPGADEEVLERLRVATPYVLHVGTLEPRKNVADLVRAFDLMASDDLEMGLVLAGGWGWHRGELEQQMAAARHKERIRQLGYVDDEDLPALLRNASAVAYPSREEGFGIPPLEALACGAPLVTTEGTVMAGIVGEASLLVEAGDVRGLAAALGEAVRGDPARRLRGLEIARAHDWDASAAAHVDIYEQVARR